MCEGREEGRSERGEDSEEGVSKECGGRKRRSKEGRRERNEEKNQMSIMSQTISQNSSRSTGSTGVQPAGAH